MRTLVIVAAVVALVAFAQPTPAPDHCAQYPTCQTCVAQPTCGWCSENVTLPGGQTGAQCAGFNPNGTDPFSCNGIYSTEQCVAGYVCNQTTFTCELAQPGQGNTLQNCEANCTNNGQVFLCNETSHQCMQVPQGQPNNGSYAVCEALCNHPSSHPSSSSPGPAPSPPPLYACNSTTGTCDPAPAGKGSSLQVCEQQCQQINGSQYICNKFLQKCVQLPPGIKGETLAQCEAQCQVKPTPGPAPNVVGLWRGVQISSGYVTGEFDLDVNTTVVTFVGKIGGSSSIVTVIGAPFYIPQSSDNEMWIEVSSGPGAGQTIKTITDTTGQPGPETTFATMAMSAAGGATPASIFSAMSGTAGATVYAFAKCLDQNCIFTLRGAQQRIQQRLAAAAVASQLKAKAAPTLADTDHCSQYGDSCADCIAHPFCGYCSVDVVYKDGSKGTQCAGFNPSNGSEAFVCAGRYSTEACTNGFLCSSNYTCQQTAPGQGMTKPECEALCHPTPPPTPQAPMYVCNVTTKQCLLCNLTHCPGEQPLGQCEQACTNPKPGPHGNLVGVWRGVQINNNYANGEYEAYFTNTSVTFYKDNVQTGVANITSLGADLMLLNMTAGQWSGWVISAIYQSSTENGGMYEAITFATGVPGQAPPASYDQAMYSAQMFEWAYFKCNEAPCNFNKP